MNAIALHRCLSVPHRWLNPLLVPSARAVRRLTSARLKSRREGTRERRGGARAGANGRGGAETRDFKLLAPRGKIVALLDKLVAQRGKIVALLNKLVALRGKIVELLNKLVALRGKIVALLNKLVARRGKIVAP